MRRGKELIGLPIIDEVSGEEFAKVVQIVVDFSTNKIEGFLVNKLSENDFIPSNMVCSIGRDAILVNSKESDSITNNKGTTSFVNIVPQQVSGIEVLTQKGDALGNIQDVLIDPDKMEINGLEITDGLIKDIFFGRGNITLEQIVNYNNGTMIVKP